ncbi:MAG: T9SS type A sorting domain-containing protein, partial [Ignavibacteria bacterium]|nr:T9SS type A sorting domain-containing protein [Ignavibacteria bacterium]
MDVFLLDRLVSGVEQENDNIPSQFFLQQNYPNPFNPSTQIKFGITEAANVDLRIYDVLGREVAVLVNNEYLSAGSYNAKFNATDLASGIYVYRLTAGANTVSRKMQLLK